MSDPSAAEPSADNLQFLTVETTGQPRGATCVACNQPIVSSYYAVGGNTMCPTCCEHVRESLGGNQVKRFILAVALGGGAGFVAAVIWFLVRRLANLQAGIVAVLVGFMVGAAVRKGSGGWGGLRYQVLAVLLTYGSIAANYVPDILEAFAQIRVAEPPAAVAGADRAAAPAQPADAGAPVQDAAVANNDSPPGAAVAEAPAAEDQAHPPAQAVGEPAPPAPPVDISAGEKLTAFAILAFLVLKIALTIPFSGLPENFIGVLIVGFALWEAWKINAQRLPPIMGPYQINPAPTG